MKVKDECEVASEPHASVTNAMAKSNSSQLAPAPLFQSSPNAFSSIHTESATHSDSWSTQGVYNVSIDYFMFNYETMANPFHWGGKDYSDDTCWDMGDLKHDSSMFSDQ